MKSKKNKILTIILILVSIFLLYKFYEMKQIEKRIIKHGNYFITNIINNDNNRIKQCLKKNDGSDLNEEEISIFLFNNHFYRLRIIKKAEYELKANANFWNTGKGKLIITYTALSGEEITTELDYIYTGVNEYFIADNIHELKSEKEKYHFFVDSANFKIIELEEKDYRNSSTISSHHVYKEGNKPEYFYAINVREPSNNVLVETMPFSYVKENDIYYIEIEKDFIEDIKSSHINNIQKIKNKINSFNENCYVEINDEYTEFNIYYDKNNEANVINDTTMLYIFSGFTLQVLDENPDWHLSINFYDYETKELTFSLNMR